MQKYFAIDLQQWQERAYRAEDGIFYLVTDVEAAAKETEAEIKANCQVMGKEKDITISHLRNNLCGSNIRYENALILCKERQEQITTLNVENKRLNEEIERLNQALVELGY